MKILHYFLISGIPVPEKSNFGNREKSGTGNSREFPFPFPKLASLACSTIKLMKQLHSLSLCLLFPFFSMTIFIFLIIAWMHSLSHVSVSSRKMSVKRHQKKSKSTSSSSSLFIRGICFLFSCPQNIPSHHITYNIAPCFGSQEKTFNYSCNYCYHVIPLPLLFI